MSNIFTRIVRVPGQSNYLQRISRTFCYKPVERKANPSSVELFKKLKRYNFGFKAQIIRPAQDGGRSLEIIKALPAESEDFTAESLIEVYDKLSIGPISDAALLHENFDTFIDATESILPQLSASQCAHIFKQTARAQIPMFDELTQTIANHLLRCITFITVDEIIDVDFALRKYYVIEWRMSKVFERIRQATRAAFVVRVNDELVERQNYTKLIRIMRYLSNNPSLVKNVDTASLSEQLLLTDDYEFQPNDVICTIVTLNRFPKHDEHSKQLLTKVFCMWCGNAQHIDDVKEIFELLITKQLKNDRSFSIDDKLFVQRCNQIVIEKNDMRSAFDVLDMMNELAQKSHIIYQNIPSVELIDFLSVVFNTDKHKKLKIDDYRVFCTACELSDHRPSNWDSKVVPAVKSARLQDSNCFFQANLACTLHSLGIQHDEFMEYFFNSELYKNWNKNDRRLTKVHKGYLAERKEEVDDEPKIQPNINSKSYMSWLTSDLEKFVGSNKVMNNVTLNKDLTVPLVLKVNTETGNFMDMKEGSRTKNLMCNKNELIIGVLTQDISQMNDNFEAVAEQLNAYRAVIKEKGWVAITLDKSLYGTMETYKRAFTFFKIILYAINNRTRKT